MHGDFPNLFGHFQDSINLGGAGDLRASAASADAQHLRLNAGRPLFNLGLALVQASSVPINYLLHAADVVDGVTDPALASYKFLTQTWAEKQPLYEHLLTALNERYELVPTREFVEGGGWMR